MRVAWKRLPIRSHELPGASSELELVPPPSDAADLPTGAKRRQRCGAIALVARANTVRNRQQSGQARGEDRISRAKRALVGRRDVNRQSPLVNGKRQCSCVL